MRAREKYFVLGLAILLAIFFRETWFSGLSHFARDITYVFHPMHVFTAENMQAGRLPLWNPYVAAGVPWMGDPQTGVFSPANVPFFLFPFAVGFKLHQALHFFITALGAYLLVRSRRGSAGLALVCGLIWSLNGFWVARLEFPSLLGTIAWLPYLLLLSPSRSGTFLSSLVLAFSFLAGHTPHFVWVVALWIFWNLAESGFRRFKAISQNVMLALGLTSVQWLNTLQAFWESERFRSGLSLADAAQYSLTPRQLLGWIIPFFSALREFAFTGERFFWLGSFYVGVVGAVLAIVAWKVSSAKHQWIWLGLFLSGGLLAMGTTTPFYGWLHGTLPFLRGLRYPAQFSFFLTGASLVVIIAATERLSKFLRPRLCLGVCLIALIEMFFFGHNRFPLIESRYFHERPRWILAVQKATGGLFFTPMASTWTKGEGRTPDEQWTNLRSRLLNLGAVPYHVFGISPFGFAFIPRATAQTLSRVYSFQLFDQAIGELSSLNVRWLAAPQPLLHGGLILRERSPWYLYESMSALPPAYWQRDSAGNNKTSRPTGIVEWAGRWDHPNRCVYSGSAMEAGTVSVLGFSYPGWKVYLRHKSVETEQIGARTVFSVSAGIQKARFLFRPKPFVFGLGLSTIMIMLLALRFWKIVTIRHYGLDF